MPWAFRRNSQNCFGARDGPGSLGLAMEARMAGVPPGPGVQNRSLTSCSWDVLSGDPGPHCDLLPDRGWLARLRGLRKWSREWQQPGPQLCQGSRLGMGSVSLSLGAEAGVPPPGSQNHGDPHIRTPKYFQYKLTEVKGEINGNIIIGGEFNTHFQQWRDGPDRKSIRARWI